MPKGSSEPGLRAHRTDLRRDWEVLGSKESNPGQEAGAPGRRGKGLCSPAACAQKRVRGGSDAELCRRKLAAKS